MCLIGAFRFELLFSLNISLLAICLTTVDAYPSYQRRSRVAVRNFVNGAEVWQSLANRSIKSGEPASFSESSAIDTKSFRFNHGVRSIVDYQLITIDNYIP